jgi:hypothetical protein
MELAAPKTISFSGNVAENWKRWKQQFRNYLTATEKDSKPDKLQVCTLLHCMGEDALDIFNTFKLNEDAKLNDVIEKFDAYCNPRTCQVFERYKFWSRDQQEGETVDAYVTELKKMSVNCAFDNLKDSLIRDKLVFGINDEKVRERLLREETLDLKKAVDMCRAAEMTKHQIKNLNSSHSVLKVGKATAIKTWDSRPSHTNSECGACGYRHGSKRCPAIGKECSFCKKYNHFQAKCKQKQMANNTKVVNAVEEASAEADSLEYFSISSLQQTNGNSQWTLNMAVNGELDTRFKMDTGADVNILPVKIFQALTEKPRLEKTGMVLTAYGGTRVTVLGQADFTVEASGRKPVKMKFVIADAEPPILGLKGMLQLNLVQRIDSVDNESYDQNKVLLDYAELFTDELGCLPYVHRFVLNPNAIPVVHAARRVPITLLEPVKKELQRLVDLKVVVK